MKRYFGCHVSCSGGFQESLRIADELDINAIQIHPSPPQRWNSKPFPDGCEDAYLERKTSSKVEKLFFHGIYLINLATGNPVQLEQGKVSLVNYLDLAHRLQAEGVIFHVGSGKDHEDEEGAWAQAAAAIND